jgi:3-hydroxybutyryl-CoA dehydrogenase
MVNKHIIIAGEVPFIDGLQEICSKGHRVDVYNITDLDDQDNLDRLVSDASGCDVFIESLNESASSKLWLIEGIEVNMKENALLLSNTLCTSATEVASWCENPRRVVGFGLLPPIKAPGAIEFVPALQTDVQISAQAREFWQRLGCEVVRAPDSPGMVRGRLLCTLINEAIFALDHKIASAEDIDTAFRLSLNLPRGPLAWADEIGLDVVLGTLTGMYEFWNEERFRPAPLLKQKVRAKHLGKKTGRGFFVDPLVIPTEY